MVKIINSNNKTRLFWAVLRLDYAQWQFGQSASHNNGGTFCKQDSSETQDWKVRERKGMRIKVLPIVGTYWARLWALARSVKSRLLITTSLGTKWPSRY